MSRSALVHLHTHGGTGRPEFSGVDLDDGKNFVPSFFNVVPHLPHALLVLSDESARGLLWMGKRSEEHTSELQSLMRISYAVFCLKKKTYSIHQLSQTVIEL